MRRRPLNADAGALYKPSQRKETQAHCPQSLGSQPLHRRHADRNRTAVRPADLAQLALLIQRGEAAAAS